MIIDLNGAYYSGEREPVRHDVWEAVSAFRAELEACGFGSPDVIADGKLHRFDLPEDRHGDKTGWYSFYADGVPAAAFGSWREGETRTWCARRGFELSAAEQERVRLQIEEGRRQREAERKAEAERAERVSVELWNASREADQAHPYLVRKGILPHGIRQNGDELIIPMMDAGGTIRGVQRIMPDGSKRFVSGIAKSGLYFYIPGTDDRLYICEGVATGASIAEATGAGVIVAFDAGNLLPVAQAVTSGGVRGSRIIIAADNDAFTTDRNGNPFNTGRVKAEKAAEAIGARVVWPEFRDVSGKPTDFNDLMALEGREECRLQLDVIDRGPRITDWGLDAFSGEAPQRRWLVNQLVPMGMAGLLCAQGGTGKGMLELDLALSVAGGVGPSVMGGEQWLGADITTRGAVVLFLAEDDMDSVKERLAVLDPDGTRRGAAVGRLHIIPLPNWKGPFSLIQLAKQGQFDVTPEFESIRRQLRRIPNLALTVFDPLASFAGGGGGMDINKDPQVGSFLMGALAQLATDTGAAVICAHHLGKMGSKGGITDIESAREAIRGTTAIVDGVRFAIAIWPDESIGKDVRKVHPGVHDSDCFRAAVVKCNCPCDQTIRSLARIGGLLVSVSEALKKTVKPRDELEVMLVDAIAEAASQGKPFSKMGGSGVYQRRDELPEDFHGMGRPKLEGMVQRLLEAEKIVGVTVGRSVSKWLDIPGGQFSISPEFADGFLSKHSAGRRQKT